jgi:hypothetical protein
MIKSYTITITEVDDAEFALEELEPQLSNIALMKNSVGIVSVTPEFIHTGVYEAVAKAVPFPLIGMSVLTQIANGKADRYIFSILVLTSDDCAFAYGSSGIIPEQGDVAGLTQECYKAARAKLTGDVKLAFLYAPFSAYHCSPQPYLDAIADIDGSVPVFGSLATCEVTKMADDTRTLCCEHDYQDRLAMLLVSGDISPEFYIGSVVKEAVLISSVGEVTAAQGNFVMEINNIKVNTAFEKIGYVDGAMQDSGTATSAFILNEKDADGNLTPFAARSLIALTDGAAIFGGQVSVGSVLSVIITTRDVIVGNTKEAIARIKERNQGSTILMYSCMGRQFCMLDEPLMEYKSVGEELADSSFNYVMACSGGEICPTSVTETKAHNSEHNQALVACVF